MSNSSYDTVVDEMLKDLNNLNQQADDKPKTPKTVTKAKKAKGQKLFSEVWGITPASGNDFACDVFKPTDWHESVRGFIPKPDPNYVVTPVVEIAHWAVQNDERPMAIGHPATGKSHLYREIAARVGMPFFRVQLTAQIEWHVVCGNVSLTKGETTFVPAPFTLFVQHGGLFDFDEVNRASAEFNMSLQRILEEGGELYLPDWFDTDATKRVIQPHKHFRLCGTDNTEGQGDVTGRHVSAQRQDQAFLDRWSPIFRVEYMSEDAERKRLLATAPGLDQRDASDIDKMVKLAQVIRDSHNKGNLEVTMSSRRLTSWGRYMVAGFEMVEALRYAWFDRLVEDEREPAATLVGKVLGASAQAELLIR